MTPIDIEDERDQRKRRFEYDAYTNGYEDGKQMGKGTETALVNARLEIERLLRANKELRAEVERLEENRKQNAQFAACEKAFWLSRAENTTIEAMRQACADDCASLERQLDDKDVEIERLLRLTRTQTAILDHWQVDRPRVAECEALRAEVERLETKHGKLENEEGVSILRARIAELEGALDKIENAAIVPDCEQSAWIWEVARAALKRKP